jgi:hypothetical protein
MGASALRRAPAASAHYAQLCKQLVWYYSQTAAQERRRPDQPVSLVEYFVHLVHQTVLEWKGERVRRLPVPVGDAGRVIYLEPWEVLELLSATQNDSANGDANIWQLVAMLRSVAQGLPRAVAETGAKATPSGDVAAAGARPSTIADACASGTMVELDDGPTPCAFTAGEAGVECHHGAACWSDGHHAACADSRAQSGYSPESSDLASTGSAFGGTGSINCAATDERVHERSDEEDHGGEIGEPRKEHSDGDNAEDVQDGPAADERFALATWGNCATTTSYCRVLADCKAHYLKHHRREAPAQDVTDVEVVLYLAYQTLVDAKNGDIDYVGVTAPGGHTELFAPWEALACLAETQFAASCPDYSAVDVGRVVDLVRAASRLTGDVGPFGLPCTADEFFRLAATAPRLSRSRYGQADFKRCISCGAAKWHGAPPKSGGNLWFCLACDREWIMLNLRARGDPALAAELRLAHERHAAFLTHPAAP